MAEQTNRIGQSANFRVSFIRKLHQLCTLAQAYKEHLDVYVTKLYYLTSFAFKTMEKLNRAITEGVMKHLLADKRDPSIHM